MREDEHVCILDLFLYDMIENNYQVTVRSLELPLFFQTAGSCLQCEESQMWLPASWIWLDGSTNWSQLWCPPQSSLDTPQRCSLLFLHATSWGQSSTSCRKVKNECSFRHELIYWLYMFYYCTNFMLYKPHANFMLTTDVLQSLSFYPSIIQLKIFVLSVYFTMALICCVSDCNTVQTPHKEIQARNNLNTAPHSARHK